MTPEAGSPELISGPDLGGGLLFQLTFEEREGVASFAYHAQEGGEDAGGPALGSPEPFGFRHPATYCGLGGPRCFERRFYLARTNALAVRTAYNRMRFVMAAMLEQEYRASAVPAREALGEIARRSAPELGRRGIEWFVGGSAGLELLGYPASPRDVDLAVEPPGVLVLAELLSEYLIEPPAPSDWGEGHRVDGARAFVGTLKRGVRVEWAASPTERPSRPFTEEWALPAAEVPTVSVELEGANVRVARPEFALAKAARRNDASRLPLAAAACRKLGIDRGLLDSLLSAEGDEVRLRATIDAYL